MWWMFFGFVLIVCFVFVLLQWQCYGEVDDKVVGVGLIGNVFGFWIDIDIIYQLQCELQFQYDLSGDCENFEKDDQD